MPQILQMAALAAATLGTGAATMTVMNRDVADYPVPEGEWTAGNELDGRSYHIVGTALDTGEALEDELVFREGTFQSANCEEYCAFGWSDYRTKVEGGMIHFTARTECPDAPHTVVWYGTVSGGEMRVEGTWTTRRWYWTHQIGFAGSGSADPAAAVGVAG